MMKNIWEFSCIDKNRRQQRGEKILSFLFIELCLGKEKGFGIQARKNKLQKVLVVNLTPAALTGTQFIRTKEKYQMFHWKRNESHILYLHVWEVLNMFSKENVKSSQNKLSHDFVPIEMRSFYFWIGGVPNFFLDIHLKIRNFRRNILWFNYILSYFLYSIAGWDEIL